MPRDAVSRTANMGTNVPEYFSLTPGRPNGCVKRVAPVMIVDSSPARTACAATRRRGKRVLALAGRLAPATPGGNDQLHKHCNYGTEIIYDAVRAPLYIYGNY